MNKLFSSYDSFTFDRMKESKDSKFKFLSPDKLKNFKTDALIRLK